MQDWIKDISYVLMPCRHPVKGHEKEYDAAYDCWRAAWEKFRAEIGITEKLTSDGFIIPDEMGVLFYKGECVGLASFTYGLLDHGPMPDHSWYKAWSQEAFHQLMRISNDAIICSQFTIHPKFAGKDQVVRWKEILVHFTHMRFYYSTAGVMAGHLNLTKGMQNACGEEHGAVVLDPLHLFNYYGVELKAQLVAYERNTLDQMTTKKNLLSLWNQLWAKTVHRSEYPIVLPAIPLKRAA